MQLSYVHWVIISFLTYASGAINTFSLIKHIEKCRKCSPDAYIQSKALNDVRVLEYSAIAITTAVGLYQFTKRYSSVTKSGFRERVSPRAYADVELYTQYFLLAYNLLTFLMLAMVHSKCSKGGGTCDMTELNKSFSRAKLVFGLLLASVASYVGFYYGCPRERWGVPAYSTCKRVLCENSVNSPLLFKKFEERLARKKKEFPNDESKFIRAVGLRDKAGERIQGDEPGLFSETLAQIQNCVGARKEETELMGFRASSWGEKCSSTQFKDALKRQNASSSSSDRRYGRRRRKR